MKPFLIALAALCILIPGETSAATPRPSVKMIAPEKKAEFSTTDSMDIEWETKNITRDMVVATDVVLVKKDPKAPQSGFVSGGGYMHTVYAGDTTNGFTLDWSSNDVVPGTYAITMQLHECSKQGCDNAPPGKKVGKKTKAVKVTVTSNGNPTEGSSNGSSYVHVLSPNGDEEYKAGSGKKLSIKWEATNVPPKSRVCVTLERQGTRGGFFAFPGGGGSCKSAKEGKGSVTGILIQTPGYNLAPGKYWAKVSLVGPSTGGKDGASIAHDHSDDVFILR